MPTQLELFTPLSDYGFRVLPKTDLIQIPFTFEPVNYLLNLPSSDFDADGLSEERNREEKRSDWDYWRLKRNIAENGYMDPVYLYTELGEEHLGNGHHRVVAAYDLGYSHVPVTRDENYQWSESGITSH